MQNHIESLAWDCFEKVRDQDFQHHLGIAATIARISSSVEKSFGSIQGFATASPERQELFIECCRIEYRRFSKKDPLHLSTKTLGALIAGAYLRTQAHPYEQSEAMDALFNSYDSMWKGVRSVLDLQKILSFVV